MLKVQLRSKIAALGSGWEDIEDILTGDFFGALDYLPRRPFLADFLEWVARLNDSAKQPARAGVDWDATEFNFWPMVKIEDEAAEPDVVIVSDRWVLVVEVKLDSGLGRNQPWREYCVGREIARERGLPEDSVFYLLVARQRLDVAHPFVSPNHPGRSELIARTSYLLWHQVVALVARWLKYDVARCPIRPEHHRMLVDLMDALRRRRSIAFSGFAFTNQESVSVPPRSIFCPDRFAGFLRDTKDRPVAAADVSRFLSRFLGFLGASPETLVAAPIFTCPEFPGFLSGSQEVNVPGGPLFSPTAFSGFLTSCPRCDAASIFSIPDH